MRLRETWIVLQKELLDSLRDRRTWSYSIILPLILVPLLMVATSMGASDYASTLQKPRLPLAVTGAENAPSLVEFLEEGEAFQVVAAADGEQALADKAARVNLVIPAGFEQAVAGVESGSLTILYNGTDPKAMLLKERLTAALQAYSQMVVTARLSNLGLDARLVQPVHFEVKNLGPEEQQLGLLALMLPMFLALWGAVGGMHVAIDVTAGEKERGTLETLLAAPVSRLSLVAGKFLTVWLAAVFAQVVSLVAFVVGFRLKHLLVDDPLAADFSLSWANILGIVLASLVLAALFAAVEIAISVQTRSTREAQSFQAPIGFAAMMPWLLVQFLSPADVPGYMFYIPLLNTILLYKELILGIVRPEHVVAAVASSGILAAVAVRWAATRFRQERILFRV